MTISPDKTYRTRDGRPVRIYATDGSGCCPVHGAVWNKRTTSHTGWEPIQWHMDGCFPRSDRLHPTSLVEVTLADELRDQIPWEALRPEITHVAGNHYGEWQCFTAEPEFTERKGRMGSDYFWRRIGQHPMDGARMDGIVAMPDFPVRRWAETLIERPEET